MALLSPVRAAAGAALAVLAGACDFSHPPTYLPADEDQLLVGAVLHAGSDSAAVLLVRVGTEQGPPPAVSGAAVRIVGPGGAGVLAEVTGPALPCDRTTAPAVTGPPVPTGCYVGVVPGGIRAGAEYRLEVDVPTGERVRGRTVVPLPPVIHAPAEWQRVRGEQTQNPYTWMASAVDLRWTAAGAVTLTGSAGRAWSAEVAEPRCVATLQGMDNPPLHTAGDSLVARMYLLGCRPGPNEPLLQPDSGEVRVDVTAFDSAMTAYMRQPSTGNGVPRADASTGLQGAFGIFGSAATSRRQVLFIAVRTDSTLHCPGPALRRDPGPPGGPGTSPWIEGAKTRSVAPPPAACAALRSPRPDAE